MYRDHLLAPGSSTTLPGRPAPPAMSLLAAGGPPVVPPAPAGSSLPYHPYGNGSGHLRKDFKTTVQKGKSFPLTFLLVKVPNFRLFIIF